MVAQSETLMTLVRAILDDDVETATRLLAMSEMLAKASAEQGATRPAAKEYFLAEIAHYMYEGDTALHIAAAGYRSEIARLLLSMGARPTRGRSKKRSCTYSNELCRLMTHDVGSNSPVQRYCSGQEPSRPGQAAMPAGGAAGRCYWHAEHRLARTT